MTDAGAATASGAASDESTPAGATAYATTAGQDGAHDAANGPVEAIPGPDDPPGPAALSTASGGPSPAAPSRRAAALDLALRVVGGVIAVLLAVITAVAEIFYSPLRLGGVLIGVSVVIAVVVNFWLLRYTVAVTGARWAAIFPPLVWFGVMMAGSGRSSEGDLLLADSNWVALVTIFAGSLAFAVAGYRLILPPMPRSPAVRPGGGAGGDRPAQGDGPAGSAAEPPRGHPS